MSESQTNFGVHLTMDGYKGDPEKLNNFELVYRLLDELPDKMAMRKLIPPYVVIVPPSTEKDQGGISGFVMIYESHISIHTFPEKGFVSIDIYTCKNDMDAEFVENYFQAAFGLKDLEVNKIIRGTKFLAS
jgi:S-adenosylmethionine decarboxylase